MFRRIGIIGQLCQAGHGTGTRFDLSVVGGPTTTFRRTLLSNLFKEQREKLAEKQRSKIDQKIREQTREAQDQLLNTLKTLPSSQTYTLEMYKEQVDSAIATNSSGWKSLLPSHRESMAELQNIMRVLQALAPRELRDDRWIGELEERHIAHVSGQPLQRVQELLHNYRFLKRVRDWIRFRQKREEAMQKREEFERSKGRAPPKNQSETRLRRPLNLSAKVEKLEDLPDNFGDLLVKMSLDPRGITLQAPRWFRAAVTAKENKRKIIRDYVAERKKSGKDSLKGKPATTEQTLTQAP